MWHEVATCIPVTLPPLCAGDGDACFPPHRPCLPSLKVSELSHRQPCLLASLVAEWCRNVLINGELLKVEVQTIIA